MRPIRTLLAVAALCLGGMTLDASAHITVNSPNGGETLNACQTFPITWTVFDVHLPGTTDFELSTDSGATWIPIELGVPSNGGTGVFMYDWCVNNVSSTNCRVKVTNVFPGGQEIDFSNIDFTIVGSSPCVCYQQADVGGFLKWIVDAPTQPGELGIVFSSITGDATTFPLIGGVSIQLVPDIWTLLLLAIPSVSQRSLDANGRGETVPIPLPNNPGLVGLNLWTAAGIWDLPGGPFVDATTTAAGQLQ